MLTRAEKVDINWCVPWNEMAIFRSSSLFYDYYNIYNYWLWSYIYDLQQLVSSCLHWSILGHLIRKDATLVLTPEITP